MVAGYLGKAMRSTDPIGQNQRHDEALIDATIPRRPVLNGLGWHSHGGFIPVQAMSSAPINSAVGGPRRLGVVLNFEKPGPPVYTLMRSGSHVSAVAVSACHALGSAGACLVVARGRVRSWVSERWGSARVAVRGAR